MFLYRFFLCETFAENSTIMHNVKQMCVCFKPKLNGNNLYVPNFTLSGHAFIFADNYKYCSAIILGDCSNDNDVTQQLLAIYSRGNMLVNCLSNCII